MMKIPSIAVALLVMAVAVVPNHTLPQFERLGPPQPTTPQKTGK